MFRTQQEGSSAPPDPSDLVVIDWQATGGGHLSTEVFYMLIQASSRNYMYVPLAQQHLLLSPQAAAADSGSDLLMFVGC